VTLKKKEKRGADYQDDTVLKNDQIIIPFRKKFKPLIYSENDQGNFIFTFFKSQKRRDKEL